MLKSLHPHTNNLISFKEYKEFSLLQGFIKINDAPSPHCPVCHNDMIARAGQVQDNGHFAHEQNVACPTKNPAARPYLGLTRVPINSIIVQTNKNFVENNLEAIFTRISEIAPFLELKEFVEILKEARRLNVYKYANLIPEYIPYVFVTLINFLPKNSFKKLRKLKFMFFYESNINSFEYLWINNGFNSNLYRISYDKSISKKVTKIDTTTTYLTLPTKTLSPNQINWCLREM